MAHRRFFVPCFAAIGAIVAIGAIAAPLAADVIHVPADEATIQDAISAAFDGDEIVVAPGEHVGFDFAGRSVVVRSSGGPDETRLTRFAGSIVTCAGGEGPGTRLEGFKLSGAVAEEGGGVYVANSDLVIVDCIFSDNEVVAGGGGLCVHNSGNVTVDGCTFRESVAGAGAGIFAGTQGGHVSINVIRSSFIGNETSIGGGMDLFAWLAGTMEARVSHCLITGNSGSLAGGGIVSSIKTGGTAVITNCVFQGNSSLEGAAIIATGPTEVVNCVMAYNYGWAVEIGDDGVVDIRNSILWGNTDTTLPFPFGNITVSNSIVEGGWTGLGENNLDADPLFVQPGSGNLRLLAGSPALDTGDTSAIGSDVDDLDGDGDTAEPMPVDLAGIDRVQDAIVDMGPYEGAYAPGAPLAGDDDLDLGELAILVPGGGTANPIQNAMVLMTNQSGSDDAEVMVTLNPSPPTPHDGWVELVSVLTMETTLADGEHLSTVAIPFRIDDLLGSDPFDVVLVAAGIGESWAPAVDGNVQPGGARIEVTGPAPFGITQVVGDHGVYWAPAGDYGFAWANVDHATDFAVGIVRPCLSDATRDAAVNVGDLAAVIDAWAASDPWADLDGDGVVAVTDLVRVIVDWGTCE